MNAKLFAIVCEIASLPTTALWIGLRSRLCALRPDWRRACAL